MSDSIKKNSGVPVRKIGLKDKVWINSWDQHYVGPFLHTVPGSVSNIHKCILCDMGIPTKKINMWVVLRSSCSACGSGWFGDYVENNLCFDCALRHKRNPIIEKLNLIRS